ncbi:uncharacterized protein TNCV_3411571 [Trichonephila clavipes]|nr:uncharacterized protein TNCV_3411571 [Trichonephila clavipes]
MIVHDGTPKHLCAAARDWLGMAYPGTWIERGGPFNDRQISQRWIFPQVSSVSRDVVTTLIDLVALLHASCSSVGAALLQCVNSFISRRSQACLDMLDGTFCC